MQITDHADQKSAYEISEIPGGVDRELERLRSQALLSWAREERHLRWFGLRDGMSVLDVGSGPGFVSGQLLDMLPNGSVTALEVDPVMVERAEKYLAGRTGERLRLVQGSLMNSGLPPASYDFAYARLIFQHLPDPVAAAREIKHLLKPGGKLVIMDIDDRLHLFDPEDPPEVQAISNRFIEEHKQKGGDRNIGRKLLRILRDAGFVDVSLDLIGVHSDEYGIDTMAPVAGDDAYRALLEEGKITQEELELMVAADKRAHEPDAISMYVIFTACGTKLE